MADPVTNNEARNRYALRVDGDLASAAYERRSNVIAFTHTIVPEALQGRGIASRLIAGALADVRARGLKMSPECPFVEAYVERHPAERDLLA